MKLYSSGKHANLTADPRPYRDDAGRRYTVRNPKGRNAVRLGALGFDPRPEFDRPLNNPANPILVEFRAHPETLKIGVLHAFDQANGAAWVEAGEPYDAPGSDWWEVETHAMRVIERLGYFGLADAS